MTYEEIVAKAKKEFGSADVSSYKGHLALQINVTGEGEGIFYAEISEGKLFIEPYDYKNNDAVLTAGGSDIIDILSGKLDPVKAFESGKLSVTGDLSKALSIQPVIENNKKTAKKTTRKSTSAKASEKDDEKTEKTVRSSAAKTTSRTSAKSVKAANKETGEIPAIIGLSEPKKVPEKSDAPKSATKKSAVKAAKESTKSAAKKSAKSSKNKKG